VIQLLHLVSPRTYPLWTRIVEKNGRENTELLTFKQKHKAIMAFHSVFAQKTGNPWGNHLKGTFKSLHGKYVPTELRDAIVGEGGDSDDEDQEDRIIPVKISSSQLFSSPPPSSPSSSSSSAEESKDEESMSIQEDENKGDEMETDKVPKDQSDVVTIATANAEQHVQNLVRGLLNSINLTIDSTLTVANIRKTDEDLKQAQAILNGIKDVLDGRSLGSVSEIKKINANTPKKTPNKRKKSVTVEKKTNQDGKDGKKDEGEEKKKKTKKKRVYSKKPSKKPKKTKN